MVLQRAHRLNEIILIKLQWKKGETSNGTFISLLWCHQRWLCSFRLLNFEKNQWKGAHFLNTMRTTCYKSMYLSYRMTTAWQPNPRTFWKPRRRDVLMSHWEKTGECVIVGTGSLSRGGTSIGFGGESRVTNSGVKGRMTGKLGDTLSRCRGGQWLPAELWRRLVNYLTGQWVFFIQFKQMRGLSHYREKVLINKFSIRKLSYSEDYRSKI